MRTPDEIKKGLKDGVPYHVHKGEAYLGYTALVETQRKMADALAYIQLLEAERDAMKEALGLMVYQYCVSGSKLDHRYMCAGETAFRVLGLEQYGDTSSLESWLFPEYQEKEESRDGQAQQG